MTGQAVTAASILAVVTSLLISVVTAPFNRRTVLISLSGVLVLSNVLAAFLARLPQVVLAHGISVTGARRSVRTEGRQDRQGNISV